MDAIFAILLGYMIGIILYSAICHWFSDNMSCNSKYNLSDTEVKLDIPEYKVSKIQERYTKNNLKRIAEYTLENFYISGKNDVSNQTLVLYDEIGKYNIGDTLTFTKIN